MQRIAASAISISWIPLESTQGALKKGFDFRISHYDPPPPDAVRGRAELERLRDNDAFRFSNFLSAWVDVDDSGQVVDAGLDPDSGLVIGSTTVRVAKLGVTFRAIQLPTLRQDPDISTDGVRFVQTVGGRTGVPLPRPVPRAPFVQWLAPVVWTTLALTIRSDRSTEVELIGASAFPRHWVYDSGGRLNAKSGLIDQSSWVAHSFGARTPWGEQDGVAVLAASVTEQERRLSEDLLRPDAEVDFRRLPAGAVITKQGEPGDELFLLLDGLLTVDVNGEAVGEVGPGAILGERALLEGGARTATLVAATPVRLAVVDGEAINRERLREIAIHHRREETTVSVSP